MKTIKIMSIAGIIFLGLSLFFIFIGFGTGNYAGAAEWGVFAILYSLPYSIVCLVAASRSMGK